VRAVPRVRTRSPCTCAMRVALRARVQRSPTRTPFALSLRLAHRPSLHAQSSCGGALWGGGALTAAAAVDQSAPLVGGRLEQVGGSSVLEDEDERTMDEALQRSMDDVLLALGEVEAQELE